MARKSKDITITAPPGSRDLGKTFRLDEMDAERGEEWAIRAILALTNAGVDVGEAQGMQAIARAGLEGLGKLKFEDAKPLLDEMFTCVSIVPDVKKSAIVARALRKDDIEEVATRLQLRVEVFKLHVDFSKAGGPSKGSTSRSRRPAHS